MPPARKPRHTIIADDVARAIERGQYPVGTLLPSEAELRAIDGSKLTQISLRPLQLQPARRRHSQLIP